MIDRATTWSARDWRIARPLTEPCASAPLGWGHRRGSGREPRVGATPLRLFAGRYVLHREIYRGYATQIWAARDTTHRRRVVIKTLRPYLATPAAVERFCHEIDVLAECRHRNVVALLEADSWHGVPYYTMPYMKEGSLRARLLTRGHLAAVAAVDVVRQAAAGLSHVHARGVVHRDVKPSNILLSGRCAVLADFGIALSDRLTTDDGETYTTAGTPDYMSPEQIDGREPTVRSDIYAMGCMLFELLTGRRPFAAPTARMTRERHLREPPIRLAAIDASLARFDPVLRCALAKWPDDRFSTCDTFIDALLDA